MKKDTLFWELTTPRQSQSSLIVGTMHLGHTSCLSKWPRIKSHIPQFRQIYTESSLAPSASADIQQVSVLRDETVLDYMSARRWDKVCATCDRYLSIDIRRYQMLHPIFLLTQVQLALIGGELGTPLDHLIYAEAVDLEKVTLGIETTQDQINTMLQLDKKYLYHNLVGISKNISKSRRQIMALLKLYEEECIQKLYEKSARSLGPDKGLLLRDRNVVMADRIMAIHEEEPSFFSFGAGHLAGQHGVLRLLKRLGGILKPI